MIHGENIICLSSIDWDFNWQGHQEIMSALARHGNRVLFIENTGVRVPTLRDLPRLKRRIARWRESLRGFRQVHDHLWVFSPIILPFPYSRLARWMNRRLLLKPIKRWMRAMGFYDPVIWTFLPTGIALDVMTHLHHKLAVYYCIADFEELVPKPEKIRRTERALVKRCDLVFAQGKALEARCRQWNDQVHIFPFGVNLEAFERCEAAPHDIPEDMRHIPRPIVGYIGGVHRHIDFELLRFIAAARPDWSLVLVGPVQADVPSFNGYRNVFLLGQKEFTELPHYIRAFDVGIIPYVESNYTKTVYPTKLNEYHLLGKPVISTCLPEVVTFNERYGSLVHVARGYPQFVEEIHRALTQHDPGMAKRRIASARENAWHVRIAKMSDIMEECLGRESEAAPEKWQERLAAVYRRVKRRTIASCATLGVAYVLAFHSPLMWWVAKPLSVTHAAREADAIVVFAGGVGESGQAGQGYAERVERAVALYRQRLAQHLVFSSGYVYALNETELMRALAVSLEVPPSAIRLESQAKNTVENVRFTSEIARQQGWRSFLLVSSPYHMRRSLLVFRRQAPDLDVIAAPVSETLFFNRSGRIRLRQWRAILHEYLGIVYYWWKGYL